MTDLDRHLRRAAANHEAKRLGYRIAVQVVNRRTLRAVAHPLSDETAEGRFLCYGSSPDAIDTLEEAVEVLRGVVERRDPWPGER